MSVAAHTRGGWVVSEDHTITTEDGVVEIATVLAAFDFPCVEEEDRPALEAECAANAKLIAAAPDLLAAAMIALETLAPQKDDDFVWAAMTQITAAIAKARS